MAERYEPDTDLDRRLRAALDAPPGTAERVARTALADPGRKRHRAWPRLAAAGGGVIATILVALVMVRAAPWHRGPERTGEPPVAEARYAITNRDGLLVVRRLDGGATVLRSGERTRESPPGMFLIVRGGSRP